MARKKRTQGSLEPPWDRRAARLMVGAAALCLFGPACLNLGVGRALPQPEPKPRQEQVMQFTADVSVAAVYAVAEEDHFSSY